MKKPEEPARPEDSVPISESPSQRDPEPPLSVHQKPDWADPFDNGDLDSPDYKLRYQSGPLPDPATLAGYEVIIEGAAERILKSFEKEGDFRREMDREAIRAEIQSERRGQHYGLIVALAVIAAAAFAMHLGYPGWGSGILLTGLGGIVGVFIHGRRRAEEPDEDSSDH